MAKAPSREFLPYGEISRRLFVRGTAGLGASAALAAMGLRVAGAQPATPGASPAASPLASPLAGVETTSITRDDYIKSLKDHFKFTEPQKTGGDVVYVNSSDMSTLNAIIRVDTNAIFVIGNIYNQLVTQSPADGSWAPDLADYWTVGADGVTYTFYLNKDAKWHDGEPVTADDVIFSFDAALDPKGLSPWRANLTQNLKSHTKIDDHTVQLVSKQPMAVFLNKTAALIGIMPKHIWGSIPVANWASAPGSTGTDPKQVIGSGPFKFVEWVQGDHATIERNADYWVPELVPTVDRFIYTVVADQNSMLSALKTGEADIADIPSAQVAGMQGVDGITVDLYDTWSWAWFCINQDPVKGTFGKDKAVRQAMMYALDRDAIVNNLLSGNGVVMDGPEPVLSRAYKPDALTTKYTYDVEKAKSLLDAAGWVAGSDGIRAKNGVKLSAPFNYESGDTQQQQIVTYLQQAWKEIGLDIQPTAAPQSQLIELVVNQGNYQLAFITITWTEEDQGVLYRSDATPEKGGFNLARWANADYDKLNDAQLVELDDAKRMELIEQASDIVNEEVADGMLFFFKGATGYATTLHNFVPNAYGDFWQAPFMWVES